MSIPQEILDKYGLPTLEVFRENMVEGESEVMYWQQFLNVTDYISNKIVDELIDDLASATALQFITVFIDFIKKIKNDYNKELRCRKFAREEINRLQGE
jgi:hypothetical protein